jgi:hypothetical protein
LSNHSKGLFMKRSALILLFTCLTFAVMAQENPGVVPAKPDTLDIRKEDRVEVRKENLPPKMQAALKEDKYAGWETGNVFFEKGTEQFILHMATDNTTRTFRFDKDGNPLETPAPIDDGRRP